MRAMMSVVPLGANGTMILMGRDGQNSQECDEENFPLDYSLVICLIFTQIDVSRRSAAARRCPSMPSVALWRIAGGATSSTPSWSIHW